MTPSYPSRIVGHIVQTNGTRTNFELGADGNWVQSGASNEELAMNVDLLDAMGRHLTSFLTQEGTEDD
jgi:hypothetical protein